MGHSKITLKFFFSFLGFRQLNADEVSLSSCKAGTCKLKRKTDVEIALKFRPDRDIKSLRTSVQALIGGFPFPFVGVDGQSACDFIFEENGTKTRCPLKKGKTYVYKNSFKVLEVYPRIQLIVHWALKSENADVICFEVPARII